MFADLSPLLVGRGEIGFGGFVIFPSCLLGGVPGAQTKAFFTGSNERERRR